MDAIYIMHNNWAFLSVLFLIFLLCFHLLNDNFHSNNCPQTSVQLPVYPKCLAQKSQMLDSTHLLKKIVFPTQGTQTTVQLNNPPNFWQKNQERKGVAHLWKNEGVALLRELLYCFGLRLYRTS